MRKIVLALLWATPAFSQTTLQLDDGSMEQLWSLTSPNAGPNDWVGAAYDPGLEFPFAVLSATTFFQDRYCCRSGICTDAQCVPGADWERRIIGPANLTVDPAGLTPDPTRPIALQTSVAFAGAGATGIAPPWVYTPDLWTLPSATIFDHPGRIFYAIKYFDGDEWMRFAVDDNGATASNGFGITTNDGFATRASIWSFGNVGMRLAIQPVFFLKLATLAPASFQVAGTTGVPMLSLRVRGGTAATTVTRVRITGSGSGNEVLGINAARLVVDNNRNGQADPGEPTVASGSFSSNNGTCDLLPNRTLAVGVTEEWLVVYDFSSAAAGGDTFRVAVNAAGDVLSSAGAPFMSGTTSGTGRLEGNLVTIAGRLVVSAGPNAPAARVVPAGAVGLATLQMRFLADNEDFSLSALRISAGGSLHDVASVTNVRLVRDADNNGVLSAGDVTLGSGTFTADDGQLLLTFAPQTISRNTSRDFLVLYDLAAAAPGGSTFRSLLGAASDVTATGAASGALPLVGPRALQGAPVIGELATVGGALTAVLGPATPAVGTAQPGSLRVPMLQFQLSAQGEGAQLGTLTLSGSGSGDEVTEVTRVRLYRDLNANGLVDATDTEAALPQSFAANDGIVTFALSDVVGAAATNSYLVAYDFSSVPTGGETFAVQVSGASAISARGQASNSPLTATGNFPIQGNLRTLLGGLSLMAGAENPVANRFQPGAVEVPMLQTSVAASGENFTIQSLSLNGSGSIFEPAGITAVRMYRDLGQLGVLDAADVLLGTATFSADDGAVSFAPGHVVSAGTTERWLFTYDLALAAQTGQNFRLGLTAVNASGVLSGPITASGLPILGPTHSVGGTVRLSLGPANAGGALPAGPAEVVMLQVRATAELEPATISGVTFRASGTGNELLDVIDARLLVDTNEDGALDPVGDILLSTNSFTSNDGALSFTFPGRTLGAGAAETWIVVYRLSGAAAAGSTFRLGFLQDTDLTAIAPSGPIPRALGAPLDGTVRTALGSFFVARGNNSPAAARVRRDATNVPVLQVRLEARQESFLVSSLRFTAGGSVDDVGEVSGITLYADADGSGTLTAADTLLSGPLSFTGDDGTATFSGAINVAAGATVPLLVVASFAGTANGGSTFRLNLANANDLVVTGLGGRAVVPSGLPVSSDTVTMGGLLEVGLGAASPLARVVRRGDTGVTALQARFVSRSEPVTLSGLTLHAEGTGNDATGLAGVSLYLDADGSGTADAGEPLLGTGSFLANDGAVSFALNQPVQVGPAVHLLVRVDLSNQPVGGQTFRLRFDPLSDLTLANNPTVSIVGVPAEGALLTTGGGFRVAAGAAMPVAALVNQAQQNLPVMQLEVQAINEACTATRLRLRGVGGIDDLADLTRVRLLRDVNNNGLVDFADVELATGAFVEDDGILDLTLNRALGLDVSEAWLLVYDLAGTASNLETLGARLETNGDLTVNCAISGAVVPSGAPVASPIFTVQEDGALVLGRGAQSPAATFLARGAVRAGVLQVRAAASVQPLTLDRLAVTVRVPSGAATDIVALVELFRDVNQDGLLDRNDRLVGNGAVPDAQGRVSFDNLALPLPLDEAQFYLVAVNLNPAATSGATFDCAIATNSDVVASSGFGPALVSGAPLAGETMTVAGDLNLSAHGTPQNRIVTNDASDLVAIDFSLSAVGENFRLRRVVLTAEGTMDPASAVQSVALLADSGDGQPGPEDRVVVPSATFPEGSPRVLLSNLDEPILVGTPQRFFVRVTFGGAATVDQTLRFSIAANVDVSAEGAQIGLVSPVGAPIGGDTFVVGRSLLLALGANNPRDVLVPAGALQTPVLQFVATASNEDVTLTRLALNTSGSLEDTSGIAAVHLYVDRDADGIVGPADVEVAAPARPAGDDGKVSFGPIAELIPRGTTTSFLVTVDLSGRGRAGQDATFSVASDSDVTAFGALSGAVAVEGAPLLGAKMTLAGALNVRLGNASPLGGGVRRGDLAPILQMEIFSRGEAVQLRQLALRLLGSADDTRDVARVLVHLDRDADGAVGDGDQVLAEATPNGDDARVEFNNLQLQLPADDRIFLLVVVQIADAAEVGGQLRLVLEANTDLVAQGESSGALTPVGAPIQSSQFTILRTPTPPAPVEEGGCGCNDLGQRSTPAWLLLVLPLLWRRRCSRT